MSPRDSGHPLRGEKEADGLRGARQKAAGLKSIRFVAERRRQLDEVGFGAKVLDKKYWFVLSERLDAALYHLKLKALHIDFDEDWIG